MKNENRESWLVCHISNRKLLLFDNNCYSSLELNGPYLRCRVKGAVSMLQRFARGENINFAEDSTFFEKPFITHCTSCTT